MIADTMIGGSTRGWTAVALCGALLIAAPAAAQSVTYLTYTPSVIPPGATAPLLIEAEISGRPSRVTVDFNPAGTLPASIPLADDGSAGDRVAGDGTYTAQLAVAPILAARTADDVHRVFIGYLNLFNGAASIFRGNLFVDVYADDVGTYPITRLSQFVQATSSLVNIHDPAFFVTRSPTRVIQDFYRAFGDDYDGLNLISDPLRFANRNHSVIKNQVRGIGLAQVDNAAAFGSAGRLQGLSQFPIPGFYDGAATGYIHELGHQWINFLSIPPFATGIPHWPISAMAAGVMGFSIGGMGGQGGDFPCTIVEQDDGRLRLDPRPDAPPYTDLDLYLMGLMPPAEVRSQIVFADQAAVSQLRCTGQIFSGPITRVSADEIVAALGPREPPFGEAPARFRLATILVTRNALATPEQMWLYSFMTERAEWRARVPTHSGFSKQLGQPFHVATSGRGTLEVDVDLGRPDFAVAPASGEASVTAGEAASYSIGVMPRRRPFESAVMLSCAQVPVHARCVFDPAVVVPGDTGRDIGLTISTRDPDAPPGAPNTTPPGRYVVLVTGSSGELRHSTAVVITVQ